jgi:MscS family membrane protein
MDAAEPKLGQFERLRYARHLKEVLERLAVIDYADISDDPQGPAFRFPPNMVNQPVEIARDEDGVWQFSADTVEQIDALHEFYRDKPILNVPEKEKPWYERELVLGNETWRILALFGAIFVGLFIGQVLRMFFNWRSDAAERRGRTLRSIATKTMAKAAVGIFFLIGLSAGMTGLVLEHEVERFVSSTIRVVFALVIGYICFRLVDVAVEALRALAKRTGSTLNDMLVPIVSTSLRLTIIVLVALDIATAVSDQPPSAIFAGLGAGGLAIGLAAQDTIKNLFGSVMIFADRPFELGDRIVIDSHDGPVERVGFRSTRIRTLEGHLVTIPNGEMANRTIHNIGKRPYIRRTMNVRISYDTPLEQVRQALEILRELLSDHEGMRAEFPPRVFLHDFLETAVNIRAIYWFHPPDYWDYCDFGERLNLQVIERFRAAGILFALPSQRLFLKGEPEPPQSRGPGKA